MTIEIGCFWGELNRGDCSLEARRQYRKGLVLARQAANKTAARFPADEVSVRLYQESSKRHDPDLYDEKPQDYKHNDDFHVNYESKVDSEGKAKIVATAGQVQPFHGALRLQDGFTPPTAPYRDHALLYVQHALREHLSEKFRIDPEDFKKQIAVIFDAMCQADCVGVRYDLFKALHPLAMAGGKFKNSIVADIDILQGKSWHESENRSEDRIYMNESELKNQELLILLKQTIKKPGFLRNGPHIMENDFVHCKIDLEQKITHTMPIIIKNLSNFIIHVLNSTSTLQKHPTFRDIENFRNDLEKAANEVDRLYGHVLEGEEVGKIHERVPLQKRQYDFLHADHVTYVMNESCKYSHTDSNDISRIFNWGGDNETKTWSQEKTLWAADLKKPYEKPKYAKITTHHEV